MSTPFDNPPLSPFTDFEAEETDRWEDNPAIEPDAPLSGGRFELPPEGAMDDDCTEAWGW